LWSIRLPHVAIEEIERQYNGFRGHFHLNCLAVDIKANRIFFENYRGCRSAKRTIAPHFAALSFFSTHMTLANLHH
jgi:hypothetical protein